MACNRILFGGVLDEVRSNARRQSRRPRQGQLLVERTADASSQPETRALNSADEQVTPHPKHCSQRFCSALASPTAITPMTVRSGLSFRAVGSALASNPIPLLIPCHRIVRSDGRIGDYLFGIERKQKLLTYEHVNLDELATNAISGRRYMGSATTHIFCHPTCRNARRITSTHQRWFAATNKAVEAGYRPCKVCRPHAA